MRYNLDGSRVVTRQQGNLQLSYLPGYDIIDTANLVFGFGNWSYHVTTLEQVSEEVNEKNNKVIGYKALVKVTAFDQHHKYDIERQDVGFGTGIARQYADAHESSAKEAVTDGLKRALRTFGNQFGNALYDKSQKNVDHGQQRQQIPQQTQQQQQVQQSPSSYDLSSLSQLGLEVQEQNGELIVVGQTFGKQQVLKELGFRWNASRKTWWQSVDSQQAA